MRWATTKTGLARRSRAMVKVIRDPPWVAPGHFYSPLSAAVDVERAKTNAQRTDVVGIDLHVDEQRALVDRMLSMWDEYLVQGGDRFTADNSSYSVAEAASYTAMLQMHRPTRVIEVGSGFSSVVALDAADRFLPDLQLTCIDPFPDRLLGLVRAGDRSRLTVRVEPVQDTPLELFESLEPRDFLFIDSTHVAKAGSDVGWLLHEVLPRLAEDVFVHVHDIFWPFEYPTPWLDEHRDWNELYMLRAFLTYNDTYTIRLFLNFVWHTMADVRERFPGARAPSGIWLERTSP